MKKDEARFTIWFSPAAPRHRIAIDAIKAVAQGRTSFIVDAIYEYLARHGGKETTAFPPAASQLHVHERNPTDAGTTIQKNFTFRFSPIDPRHQVVIEILNKAKRRKASLIADAICEYLAHRRENNVATTIPTALTPSANPNTTAQRHKTKPMVETVEVKSKKSLTQQIIKTPSKKAIPDLEPALSNDSNSEAEDNSDVSAEPNDSSFDEDMLSAVLGGLSMFSSNK